MYITEQFCKGERYAMKRNEDLIKESMQVEFCKTKMRAYKKAVPSG